MALHLRPMLRPRQVPQRQHLARRMELPYFYAPGQKILQILYCQHEVVQLTYSSSLTTYNRILPGYPPRRDQRKAKRRNEWVVTILGTFVLLILFGTLAALIPGLRCAFLVMILLIILIPWFIYIGIRNYARRTAGRLWWFL
jgi:hypothetical protein